MKLSILTSLVLTFLLSLTIIVETVDGAERSRMGTAASNPAGLSSGAPAVTPTAAPRSVKRPEPFIEEARMLGSMPCPDSASGGCCEKPTPFPGLYCCDTQDCGWYECEEDSVRMKEKMYRKVGGPTITHDDFELTN